MTPEQTRDLVAVLRATWPRPPIDAATVHAYAHGLGDLEHDAAQAAVLHLIRTSRFLPSVAEVREAAAAQRVTLPTPEQAWGIVLRAVGTVGSYRVPLFDCAEVQQAIDAIGWRSICLDENEPATRARWIAAFQGFALRRLHSEAAGTYRLPPAPDAEGRTLVRTGFATLHAAPAERSLPPASEPEPELLDPSEIVATLAARLSRSEP